MNKNLAGAILTYLILSTVYGILVLLNNLVLDDFHAIGLSFLLLSFTGTTWIMLGGKKVTLERQVQKFIVGTSLQMILVLFFVLAIRYTRSKDFAEFVWYFLPFFGLCLAVQAFWMLRFANAKK